jgi:hypothetical protein
MEVKKILVIGHPRTGTGYSSSFLNSIGLDVPHEKIGYNGTSNWKYTFSDSGFFTEEYKKDDFIWETTIITMRNPFKSVVSIALTETPFNNFEFNNKNDFFDEKIMTHIKKEYPELSNDDFNKFLMVNKNVALSSYYRKRHIYIDINKDRLTRATQSFINWYKLIEDSIKYDYVFRIEKDQINFQNFLLSKNIIKKINSNINISNKINSRSHNHITKKDITKKDWKLLPKNLLYELNKMCVKYDYENIYDQIEKS